MRKKIEEKISDWRIWRCQRKILKRHAYVYDVKPRLFESNESLRQRILEKIKYIWKGQDNENL